jgi:hypothetical protein
VDGGQCTKRSQSVDVGVIHSHKMIRVGKVFRILLYFHTETKLRDVAACVSAFAVTIWKLLNIANESSILLLRIGEVPT